MDEWRASPAMARDAVSEWNAWHKAKVPVGWCDGAGNGFSIQDSRL